MPCEETVAARALLAFTGLRHCGPGYINLSNRLNYITESVELYMKKITALVLSLVLTLSLSAFAVA